jgi:hypothetical protein
MSYQTLPTYISHGVEIQYEPADNLCSLRRYNIAQCARQRMSDAHHFGTSDESFELWKRERISFWSTLRASIPYTFL